MGRLAINGFASSTDSLRSAKGRFATSAAALALFALIFTLALSIEQSRAGILHLHAVPVAVLALQLGILVGLGAAAASLSMMFVWAELEGAELLMVDYMSGAVPLLLVVFLCQLAIGAFRSPGAATRHASLSGRRRTPDVPELTEREKDVLGLLALGHTNREAAAELYLSVRTIESHRARIQQKLGVSGRAELVRYAMAHGLATEPPALPNGNGAQAH